MTFLEKDLEQIVWESDNKKLQDRGLEIEGKKFRQLRIGNYGIADIVTLSKAPLIDYVGQKAFYDMQIITINVMELKKDIINIETFLQAARYIRGIQRYMERKELFDGHPIQFVVTLVGRVIDQDSGFEYLPDIICGTIDDDVMTGHYDRPLQLKIYTYSYDLDGITFEQERGYRLTKEGF